MRVGLLSTWNATFLGRTIRELANLGVAVHAVLLDSREESAKDRQIHA